MVDWRIKIESIGLSLSFLRKRIKFEISTPFSVFLEFNCIENKVTILDESSTYKGTYLDVSNED